MSYNPNQLAFLKALADRIRGVTYRGVFLVADGQISFIAADDLYRLQDAVVEGIASQGKLPSHSVTGGYTQMNEAVTSYDPEKEVIVLIDSVMEIMSREKIEKAVEAIANAPTSQEQTDHST